MKNKSPIRNSKFEKMTESDSVIPVNTGIQINPGFPPSRERQSRFSDFVLRASNFRKSSGFTLIELLVTITIFLVLTTAILFKNSQFKNDILITNLAYEMALSIRQAQIYGINVQGGTLNQDYKKAYGVHFDENDTEEYRLFVDADGDKQYDDDGTESEGTIFKLRGGNKISTLCTFNPGNSGNCFGKASLDISFKRPDPEAVIRANGSAADVYDGAQIHITSPNGAVRKIEVSSTGQISVLPF